MKRDQWQSQTGFLFASIGSAIGLGNIWRFSYMTYNHGGGAFLVPYFIALITTGIPLLILEFSIGHKLKGSAPLTYFKINKNMEWLGWWAVTIVMFGIILFYSVIIAWCINFFLLSFNLGWGSNPDYFFFKEFLSVSDTPFNLGLIKTPIFISLIIVWFINWAIVYRGIQQGIEVANKIFMPILFLLTAILVCWALTLDGAVIGLKAYLTPDFTKIFDSKVWIDAYSQIFFTLSLGFGIMITYASYLPKKTNITKSALITAGINSSYSLFAGFGVFSILGFMAVSQDKSIADVVSQSIGLAFVAYPKAVSMMPAGNLFGAVFFLCLVVAGFSSSISIVESFAAALMDKFDFKRGRLVTIISIFGFAGSIIFTTQAGILWLDIVDHFLTHYGLIVVGFIEAVLVGWFFHIKILRQHVNQMSSLKIGKWWDILIKYFTPLILGIILIVDLYNEVQKPYGGYSWTAIILIGCGWIILTLLIAFIFSSKSWRNRKVYSTDL